ncbi:MAG: helix-turn-helix domain-containing protein [Candidatus Acidiferrum sp.]
MRDGFMVMQGDKAKPLVVVATTNTAAFDELEPLLFGFGCQVKRHSEPLHLPERLADRSYTLLLIDQTGITANHLCAREADGPAVVLLSGTSGTSEETGDFDRLSQPFDRSQLRFILKHAIDRQLLLERIRQLASQLEALPLTGANGDDDGLSLMSRLERGAIAIALRQSGGNVRDAAHLLGLGQATVYRKIKRLGIRKEAPNRKPKTLSRSVD